jgi:hypothetical protein
MEIGDVVSRGIGSRHASPSHVKSLSGKHSLGESSNANRWFEQINTEVQDYNMACFHNNSPFFIDDDPSIQAAPTSQRLDAGTDTRSFIAPKTSLSQLNTDYVSAETFRDIVDDLTAQIGSLKRRLRRDEKSNSLISESREPFEIKIHSLKVDEKHELERILHRFVSSLPTRSGSEDMSNRYGDFVTSGKPYTVMSPRTSTLDTRSPHASDSASVSRLSLSASDRQQRGIPELGRSKKIRSQADAKYAGNCVLPCEKFELMATRTKRKLVVDRLEQLFAGENVFSRPKLQALQQPETLHEVAHVEYATIQAWNQQKISENVCAARMLSKETEILTTATTAGQPEATQRPQTSRLLDPKLKGKIIKTLRRPELEPSQLVAENVRYIREIGLSSVDSDTAKLPGDDYEWFYFNVLVNMAELHTLNVTPDFMRKAVSELSGHFIISTDGQKVRWNSVSRKRRHDDDLSENVIDETSGPKGRPLKATRGIGSPTSLRTGSKLKHAPSPWISYQSNGKLSNEAICLHED